MQVRDEAKFSEWVKANDDPYGGCCVRYAIAWADAMERLIAKGARLEDIAKETSHEVDRRPGFGITGFMYGAAVSMLADTWEHGDALRRWHNLDTQIGVEGEVANITGSTLNPALLSVGPKQVPS